jgi:hypothetical protein
MKGGDVAMMTEEKMYQFLGWVRVASLGVFWQTKEAPSK